MSSVDSAEDLEGNLKNIIFNKTLKWIFVGGKGGVGKTTCSCSLAVQLAKNREKVLIISTDPAHNLSDAFQQKFNRNPSLIEGFENLFAMEVDPTPEEGDLEGLDDGNNGNLIQEIAASIPGIDEAMSFAEVMKQVQNMSYDVIVFDTAPTGHTLRLLQFPTILEKGLQKILDFQGAMGGMMSQFASMLGVNGMDDGIFKKLETLKTVVEEVNKQFRDPDISTFVCVCIPEFLSLYETERLVQLIHPHQVGTSKLLEARVRMQETYIKQFHDLYDDFHLTKLPLLEQEVRGVEALKKFSENLLKTYTVPSVKNLDGAGADSIDELRKQLVSHKETCKALESKISELELK